MGKAWQGLSALVAAVVNWRFFKSVVFLACLVPPLIVAYELCQLLLWGQTDALGADPKKTLLHDTGTNALLLLLITLSVTPVRRLFKVNRIQSVRRMLGVWTFVYALVHVGIFLVFDRLCYSWETCQLREIKQDLINRPFIIAGMVAFTILALLAATSTSGWVRRLKKNWQRLHRLVYVAASAGIVHFLWIQKSDVSEPLRWAYWLAVLFGLRVMFAIQKRTAARPVARSTAVSS
jgi:sulfoxide reductase heme-binding subunit YedZ